MLRLATCLPLYPCCGENPGPHALLVKHSTSMMCPRSCEIPSFVLSTGEFLICKLRATLLSSKESLDMLSKVLLKKIAKLWKKILIVLTHLLTFPSQKSCLKLCQIYWSHYLKKMKCEDHCHSKYSLIPH